MNNEENIVYKSNRFDVVDNGEYTGIRTKNDSVLILPFVSDDQGLPLMVGVLNERNTFRSGGYSISVISGTPEDEDPNTLAAAQRELLEETGFDVTEEERWYFIGTLTGSKFVDSIHPCFAVDISGITPSEPKTDGSEQEKLSKFTLIPANEVISIEDPFVSSLFLRIFKYVVGMDIYNREDSIFSKKKEINTEI
jgi:8-oxo-dGTP pyrophosphatase MutT (NUDIX family)